MVNFLKACILTILCLGLISCSLTGKNLLGREGPAGMPDRFALPEAQRDRPVPEEGTIYSEDRPLDIYQDRRARGVGDIVMVKIVETSSGTKKAETKTERTSSVTGDLTYLFGIEKSLEDKNSNFSAANALKGGLTNDFDGKGETTRDSKVTATISARVVDRSLDGNLVIRGFREIRVNSETQYIILSGIIRPQDIGTDNSVLSSSIADARIEYTGNGVLTDKQQPGWLARALDVVWPF